MILHLPFDPHGLMGGGWMVSSVSTRIKLQVLQCHKPFANTATAGNKPLPPAPPFCYTNITHTHIPRPPFLSFLTCGLQQSRCQCMYRDSCRDDHAIEQPMWQRGSASLLRWPSSVSHIDSPAVLFPCSRFQLKSSSDLSLLLFL